MPRIARRRTALSTAACAVAAAAAFAAPAPAADPAAADSRCPAAPIVQPFAPWQDLADYFLAPDGDLETGAGSWSLTGGAQPVEGNEPFYVGAPTDHMSLSLPSGSAATTAQMCLAAEHRTMRFFAKGPAGGKLVVQAQFHSAEQALGRVRLGTLDGTGDWGASSALAMRVNAVAAGADKSLSVALRFSPRVGDDWQIDDVYVDPYRTK